MIEVSNIRIPLKHLDGTERGELASCRRAVARKLGIRESRIERIELRKRSIDARKKASIILIFTVRISLREDELEIARNRSNNARMVNKSAYGFPAPLPRVSGPRPVVVGAGCAGY